MYTYTIDKINKNFIKITGKYELSNHFYRANKLPQYYKSNESKEIIININQICNIYLKFCNESYNRKEKVDINKNRYEKYQCKLELSNGKQYGMILDDNYEDFNVYLKHLKYIDDFCASLLKIIQ